MINSLKQKPWEAVVHRKEIQQVFRPGGKIKGKTWVEGMGKTVIGGQKAVKREKMEGVGGTIRQPSLSYHEKREEDCPWSVDAINVEKPGPRPSNWKVAVVIRLPSIRARSKPTLKRTPAPAQSTLSPRI